MYVCMYVRIGSNFSLIAFPQISLHSSKNIELYFSYMRTKNITISRDTIWSSIFSLYLFLKFLRGKKKRSHFLFSFRVPCLIKTEKNT